MERLKHIILEILAIILFIVFVFIVVLGVIYEFYPMIFQEMGMPWLETAIRWISLIITSLFIGFAIYSYIKNRRKKK